MEYSAEGMARSGENARPSDEPDMLRAIQCIIADVISESISLQPPEVRPEWTFEGAPLAMDSVAFLRMVIAIENRFGIVLPDCDCSVAAMPTVGSIVAVVSRNLARRAETA